MKIARGLAMFVAMITILTITGKVFSSEDKRPRNNILSPQEAGKKAVSYINKYILPAGSKRASLIKAVAKEGIYEIRLKIGGRQYSSYVTQDGKLLFPQGINLTLKPKRRKVSQKIPKRDIPDVKLFVMSYCPFGLQMERAFLPVYKLLKDKARMGVYFVNYSMRGKKEVDEDVRQYCIQKKENDKYYNYLSCFVKENNFKRCLLRAHINKSNIYRCISETNKKYNIIKDYKNKSTYVSGRFPRVELQDRLNKKYKVRGSPTLVINDKVIKGYSRSPEKIKEVVCGAFNSPPKECSASLSNKVASAGLCGPE